MYSAAVGWNVLYMSVRSIWSVLLFKSFVSLLIFCLDFLSIIGLDLKKRTTREPCRGWSCLVEEMVGVASFNMC